MKWRKTIRVKQFLGEESSDALARECARNISHVLKAQHEYQEDGFDDFSVLAAEFDGIANAADGEHDAEYTLTEHVNDCLSALYDWADAERVWIG